ncbi:hypothetical protein C9374_011778 [Naegleria lovaniensis]|uniref:Uncharacterized protein n=1 Tax=Naegleria lovaniensis TaxID=51637 RepID=A0AA88KD68_NAELO|nr:uncharacterized protein C9374_011778 [Naegleria lovaniensis]KAG2373893.1 hypothetical protein C9374_011778 [Naegleria lovaniensis]
MKRLRRQTVCADQSSSSSEDEDLSIFSQGFDSEDESLNEENQMNQHDSSSEMNMNQNGKKRKVSSSDTTPIVVDIFSQLTSDIFEHEIFQHFSLQFILNLRHVSKLANQLVLAYVSSPEFSIFFYPSLHAEKTHDLINAANICLSKVPEHSPKEYLSLFANARRIFCNDGQGLLYHLRDVNFSRLEALYFHACSLDFTSVKYILKGSLSNVKFICFHRNRLGDDGARVIVEKLGQKLAGLAITSDILTDGATEFMTSSSLPSLTYLNVSSNTISEKGFQQLLNISSLKALSIAFNKMNGKEVSKGLCKLKYLNIAGNDFDSESFNVSSKLTIFSGEQDKIYDLDKLDIPFLYLLKLKISYSWLDKANIYYEQFTRCIKLNMLTEADYFKQQAIKYLAVRNTLKSQYLIGKMHVLTKDYIEALEAFNCSYSGANYEVAEIYFHGKGINRDYEKALRHYLDYLEGDVQTRLPTKYQIGYCYYKLERPKKAKSYLQKSKDNKRHKVLGKIYYHEKEFQLAYSHLEKCENEGAAAHLLSKMYEKGRGVHVSLEKAYRYLMIGAELKHPKSLYRLGKWYELGMSPFVEKDIHKAIHFYDLSKFSKARCRLGMLYYHGEHGIEINLNQAKHYFTQLPDDFRNQDAWFCLGRIFEAENDSTSAYFPYERAAALGHKLAKKITGEMDYYNGGYKRALYYLTEYLNEAEFCESVALKIARIYNHHRDKWKKSMKFYQLVDHLPEAQAEIGVYYSQVDHDDNDEPIPYSQETIMNFLETAAENGYSQAQLCLSQQYFAENNYKKSLFWMKRAFESGATSRLQLFTQCMEMGNIEEALYQLPFIPKHSLSYNQKESITTHLYNTQQFNVLMDWMHSLPNSDEIINRKVSLMFVKGEGVPKDLMRVIDILLFTATNESAYSDLCTHLRNNLKEHAVDESSIEYALLKITELPTAQVSVDRIPFLFMKVLYQHNFSEFALKLLETKMQTIKKRVLKHLIHNDPLMAIHELIGPITRGRLNYSLKTTLDRFEDLCASDEILNLFFKRHHMVTDRGLPIDKVVYDMFKDAGKEETGINYLDRIASTGNSFKKHDIALIYECHLNNSSKALHWYEQSGLPQSMFKVAEMYRVGAKHVDKDVKKSIEILEHMIDQFAVTQQNDNTN